MQRRLLRPHRLLMQRLAAAGGPRKIVFLCYGNICRSPLAAKLAEQRLIGISIESAGFHDHVGRNSPEKMLRIGLSFGVDLSDHRSERVTRDLLQNADLIVAMDLENLESVRDFPEVRDRTTLLGLFGNPPMLSIADPYLADEPLTGQICEQVRSGIDGLALWVANTKAASYAPEIASPAASSR
jgi:protein-tyrosine phosphatase